MNRRGFLSMIGLAAPAVVVSKAIAADHKKPDGYFVAGRSLGDGTYEAMRVTGAGGSHSHQICTCGNQHTHGCTLHSSGIFARTLGQR